MSDFDVGGFIGTLAKDYNIDFSTEAIAAIAEKNINEGLARVKSSNTQVAQPAPVVQPTQYAKEQTGKLPLFGFAVSKNQLIFAGVVLVAVLLIVKRR